MPKKQRNGSSFAPLASAYLCVSLRLGAGLPGGAESRAVGRLCPGRGAGLAAQVACWDMWFSVPRPSSRRDPAGVVTVIAAGATPVFPMCLQKWSCGESPVPAACVIALEDPPAADHAGERPAGTRPVGSLSEAWALSSPRLRLDLSGASARGSGMASPLTLLSDPLPGSPLSVLPALPTPSPHTQS